MKTLIKNGTVITAEITRKADVLFEGEIIRRVEENIQDKKLYKLILLIFYLFVADLLMD